MNPPWNLCCWLLDPQVFLSPISGCPLLEASLCFVLASRDRHSRSRTGRAFPASPLGSWGCRAWTGPPWLIVLVNIVLVNIKKDENLIRLGEHGHLVSKVLSALRPELSLTVPRHQIVAASKNVCKYLKIQVPCPTFSRKRKILYFANMSSCWDSELRSVPSFLGQLRKGKSFGWKLSTLDSVVLAWKLLCFNGSLSVRLWTFQRENVYNFGPYFARRERICLQHESNCVSNAPCCHFEYLSKIIFKEFLSRLKQGVLLLKLSNSYNSSLHIYCHLNFCFWNKIFGHLGLRPCVL